MKDREENTIQPQEENTAVFQEQPEVEEALREKTLSDAEEIQSAAQEEVPGELDAPQPVAEEQPESARESAPPQAAAQPIAGNQPGAQGQPVSQPYPYGYGQYPQYPYPGYGTYGYQQPGYAYPGYGQYRPQWQAQTRAPQQSPQTHGEQSALQPAGKKSCRVLATAAACLLLVGLSCGITAAVVHTLSLRHVRAMEKQLHSSRESYELQLSEAEERLHRQVESYERRLETVEKRANSGMIDPSDPELPAGMMTPAQLYSRCVPSVVGISNQLDNGNGGFVTVGTGSGFIITSDGYIVSNHHVVEGAQKLLVTLSDGSEHEAQLIGSDNINDVALLKINAQKELPAVTIGSSDAMSIGDQVVAIGNPLGDLTATATVGYLSGKDRPVNTEGTIIDMMQTDAAINSGNSGGPLFNMYGEVVGITTAKYSGTSGSGASIEGIGFAIPMDDVYDMLMDIKQYGRIGGGYLGVVVSTMDPDVASMYNMPRGAYVREVTPGSCAQEAGVQVEDIIVQLGGYDVENLSDLTRALRRFQAGDKVSVHVYRGGAIYVLTVVLDEKPPVS